jgi:hypothetical protein
MRQARPVGNTDRPDRARRRIPKTTGLRQTQGDQFSLA